MTITININTEKDFGETFFNCFTIQDMIEAFPDKKFHWFFNSEMETPIHWPGYPEQIQIEWSNSTINATMARAVDLLTGQARDISF